MQLAIEWCINWLHPKYVFVYASIICTNYEYLQINWESLRPHQTMVTIISFCFVSFQLQPHITQAIKFMKYFAAAFTIFCCCCHIHFHVQPFRNMRSSFCSHTTRWWAPFDFCRWFKQNLIYFFHRFFYANSIVSLRKAAEKSQTVHKGVKLFSQIFFYIFCMKCAWETIWRRPRTHISLYVCVCVCH